MTQLKHVSVLGNVCPIIHLNYHHLNGIFAKIEAHEFSKMLKEMKIKMFDCKKEDGINLIARVEYMELALHKNGNCIFQCAK